MTEFIQIYCKNTASHIEVEPGASLEEIYQAAGNPLRYPPMNAFVNNKAERLSYRCRKPKTVEYADYTSLSGQRTYVRTLCHILSKAVNDILPSATLCLEHPISKGYYFEINNGEPLSAETIGRIKRRMQELVDADLPFAYKTARMEDAAAMFRSRGMADKALLIETSGMLYTSYHELDGYVNFFYGSLAPSTGCITLFDVIPYAGGALLRVPKRTNPWELEPVIRQDKMFEVYKESLLLLHTLGVDNVGDLNKAVMEKRAGEIILVSEAMQEKQIAGIADEIARRYEEGLRIVLISGPSSSGKTTFAQRLCIQLKANLYHPFSISLDDYFLERKDTPLDETGDYDFESLYALDLAYFNRDLNRLLQGGEIKQPSYDFTTGTRVYNGGTLQLQEQSLLIIEGIHALNPELTAHIAGRHKYKVYVSALTSISLDSHNWIPTSDNRLLRRIVRDFRSRNYSPAETIARWESVRRGEEKWIFPYQEMADSMFNSAMLYELAALRPFVEPVLMEVKEGEKEYAEAYRLRRFLKYFKPIPAVEVPGTSLLREFVGGSLFK